LPELNVGKNALGAAKEQPLFLLVDPGKRKAFDRFPAFRTVLLNDFEIHKKLLAGLSARFTSKG